MDDERLLLFEGFVLDVARGVLLRDGQPVHLRPQTYEVLRYLVANRGRLISKNRVIEDVWRGRAVTDGSLGKCIEELRSALGDGARVHLKNVRGRGYVLEHVSAQPAPADEAEAPGPAADASTPKRRVPWHGLAYVLFAGLLLEAAHLGYDRWHRPPVDTPFRSLAVLPFESLDVSGSGEPLELGMADTLIAKLGAAAPIVVRPIGAVRRYAGSEKTLEDAGRELGVGAVLGGSFQASNGRIRVTARLVRVDDGRQLWAAGYEEAFRDIFSVQDAISERVAAELQLELSGTRKALLSKRYTQDPDAYLLYLEGQELLAQPSGPTLRRAISFFERAIAKDPSYAAAYVGLAHSYIALPIGGDASTIDIQLPFMAAVSRALELDEELADGHVALGRGKFWLEWDWEGAAREYLRAIELNPSSALAHVYYAHLLSNEARHADALVEIDRALEIDPRSRLANALKGQFLFQARRYREAALHVEATLELEPEFWIAWVVLGKCYERLGRYEEALDALSRAAALSGGMTEPLSIRGYVLAASGRVVEAKETLRQLEGLSESRYVPPYNVALVHAGLGEQEETWQWLERARLERDVRLVFLTVDPKWDPLRPDPRFASLLRKMGLPPDEPAPAKPRE